MPIHRVERTALDRQDARVAGYGRTLRTIFDDWLAHSQTAGLSTHGLTARLQDAAVANFQAAYLHGKQQAYSRSVLNADDQVWIQRTLQSNQAYLESSLASDIADKATYQRLTGADLPTLGKSFGSRVENQYGGQLWKVTEAGFRSGVQDLATAVRVRFNRALQQEDDEYVDPEEEGPSEDQAVESASIAALAILLGVTARRLRQAVDRTGASVFDLRDPLGAGISAVAADLGVSRVELARHAAQAVEQAAQQTADASLAKALGISAGELIDLGSRLSTRAGGFEVGTAYISQSDGDVCLPCQDAASGGDGNGNYYFPDEAPLPGEVCRGGGNCRCNLQTLWSDEIAA